MKKKVAAPPPPIDPVAERRAYITGKLRTAMSGIQNDPQYDWGPKVIAFGPFEEVPENPIYSAAAELMEKVQEYIEGTAAEAEIKPLYKAYVSLYQKTQTSQGTLIHV